MSSSKRDSNGSATQAASEPDSCSGSTENKSEDNDSSGMKRAAAKKLIERYYYQLTDGCGNVQCKNNDCVSSGKMDSLAPNEAAARAIQLFMDKSPLCDPNPAKIAKIPSHDSSMIPGAVTVLATGGSAVASAGTLQPLVLETTTGAPTDPKQASSSEPMVLADDQDEAMDTKENDTESMITSPCSTRALAATSQASTPTAPKDPLFLTEERVQDVLKECELDGTYSLLIRTIGQVYSSPESIVRSFQYKDGNYPLSPGAHPLTKEALRAMEKDADKDDDTQETEEIKEPKQGLLVDVHSLRRVYTALGKIAGLPFMPALINALVALLENTELDLRYKRTMPDHPYYLHVFVIVLEIPWLGQAEFLDLVVPMLCKAAAELPIPGQASLVKVLACMMPHRLKELVDTIQQVITLRVIGGQLSRGYVPNDDATVAAATKFLRILYYSSLSGGEVDSPSLLAEETEVNEAEDHLQDLLQGAVGRDGKEPRPVKDDPLGQELTIRPLDCRKPVVPFDEFYNEPLSDCLEVDKDFALYKTEAEHCKFSFLNFPFILTPAIKSLGLYYDNRIRMYSERRLSVINSFVNGAPSNPYLRLKVRRDHIIDDALVELEMIAMENYADLKKQLVVEFEGEQGIDEGGVSKEFFQLVVEEVFNPDFAMFTLNTETQTYWFNPTCFESDGQFTLIGIVLGLAIYNNVILDVHFPSVVYRKLLGKKGTFQDLADWDASLSRGLQDLLKYDGEDIEEVFAQTFRISYSDVFGATLYHDLKENGDQLVVNQENKKEFVELYADFLLNKCIERQFRAFRRGFQMVTDESPVRSLFRPEEVELLVCGSKNFDFMALEEATEYDGGYTSDTPTIRQFWEIVHEFSLEQKQKLLQFTTGSDRVPVGGLSKLKLIIARNGPDSDRLPTAHTCFNVLLLPEYSSKDKLLEQLLKAITYSKGFGML